MNKKRIFGIFILFALLITCIGVSFASNDFDASHIKDVSSDAIEIGESDLDDQYIGDGDSDAIDDSDFNDDEYWDDYELIDEDWDDEDWEDWDDEDYDLDDEDWDDEDWEDWDDEDYDLDDEDWDDEDFDDDEVDWFEEGNFTEDGKVYYYNIIAYKTGKAIGCAYMASNSADSSSSGDENSGNEKSQDDASSSKAPDTTKDTQKRSGDAPILTASENHNSLVKSIDLSNLKESMASNNSNTSEKINITDETAGDSSENGLGIFALLAIILLSILVII